MQGKKNKCGGRTIKVKVTREHILKGEFGNAEFCPIALAMSDSGLDDPNVGDQEITINDPDNEREISIITPRKLAAFLNAFDAIEDVAIDCEEKKEAAQQKALRKLKPFSFEVLLPGPASIKA